MSKNNEEFDRSRCFTFFKDYHEQIMLVKEQYGLEKAFEVYEAIVNYGLYEKEITDPKIKLLTGATTFANIESSQRKRSSCFAGEDLEMSRSIILMHLDHPEYSQNKIMKLLKTSKGKVNKTLQKYRDGEYEGVLDLDGINTNSNPNTYTNPNTNTYMTATVTEPMTDSVETQADHLYDQMGIASLQFQSEANMSDDDIRQVMKNAYVLHTKEGEKDIKNLLVKEFSTQWYYQCKNVEALEIYADYLLSQPM